LLLQNTNNQLVTKSIFYIFEVCNRLIFSVIKIAQNLLSAKTVGADLRVCPNVNIFCKHCGNILGECCENILGEHTGSPLRLSFGQLGENRTIFNKSNTPNSFPLFRRGLGGGGNIQTFPRPLQRGSLQITDLLFHFIKNIKKEISNPQKSPFEGGQGGCPFSQKKIYVNEEIPACAGMTNDKSFTNEILTTINKNYNEKV